MEGLQIDSQYADRGRLWLPRVWFGVVVIGGGDTLFFTKKSVGKGVWRQGVGKLDGLCLSMISGKVVLCYCIRRGSSKGLSCGNEVGRRVHDNGRFYIEAEI